MANKHMKSCSASLITREMQVRPTMRRHLTLVRMAVIKQHALVRMWKKGNPCALLVEMQVCAATVENSVELPQKIKNGTAF